MKEFKDEEDCEVFHDGKATQNLKVLNPSILARSLQYYIEIKRKDVAANKLQPGTSRIGGIAHWPKTWPWPEDVRFHAQLNIQDFKPYDLENVFPEKGILYFFHEEYGDTEDFIVRFFDGELSELALRPGERVTVSRPSILSFSPRQTFCIGNEYGNAPVAKVLPQKLLTALENLLKCQIVQNEANIKILGRPAYWQNEESGRKWAKVAGHKMIFQDSFGEGHVHFWIKPADLRRGVFEKIFATYSGT